MDILLDVIVEILFELFLEGASEGALSKKLHPFWRFVLLSLIIMIYAGLMYVIISLAIETGNPLVWLIAGIVLLILILAVRKKYLEKYGKNVERSDDE